MSARTSGIDPKMLELLVCPLTKGRLSFDAERNELVSEKAKLAYPVRDGIPIMLMSEARKKFWTDCQRSDRLATQEPGVARTAHG